MSAQSSCCLLGHGLAHAADTQVCLVAPEAFSRLMVSWVYLFSADSTALLISEVYQFCGGFHQLSLSTLFSFQLAVLQVLCLHPYWLYPCAGKGPFQNKSSTLNSAPSPGQRQLRLQGNISPWLMAKKAHVFFFNNPLDATKGGQSHNPSMASVGHMSWAVGSLLTPPSLACHPHNCSCVEKHWWCKHFLDVTTSQMMIRLFSPAVQIEQDSWESHSGGHRASPKPWPNTS